MITLHGEEVKLRDRVWDMRRGWGEVTGIDEKNSNYPICVQWERGSEWFTEDGKFLIEDETPTLFWQPIEFEIPKKPKQKPKEKAWQWVCRGSGVLDNYWLTPMHLTEGEKVLDFFPNAEFIEPYLPSEIEREVKE